MVGDALGWAVPDAVAVGVGFAVGGAVVGPPEAAGDGVGRSIGTTMIDPPVVAALASTTAA